MKIKFVAWKWCEIAIIIIFRTEYQHAQIQYYTVLGMDRRIF